MSGLLSCFPYGSAAPSGLFFNKYKLFRRDSVFWQGCGYCRMNNYTFINENGNTVSQQSTDTLNCMVVTRNK